MEFLRQRCPHHACYPVPCCRRSVREDAESQGLPVPYQVCCWECLREQYPEDAVMGPSVEDRYAVSLCPSHRDVWPLYVTDSSHHQPVECPLCRRANPVVEGEVRVEGEVPVFEDVPPLEDVD